jgi:multiple sugar transport system permease protein
MKTQLAQPVAENVPTDLSVDQPLTPQDLMGKDEVRRFAVALLSPAQLLLYFILVFPATVVFYLSFTDYSPISAGGKNWWYASDWWVWLANYFTIVVDPQFGLGILRTLLIVGIAVPLEFLIGLGLALLFVEKFPLKAIFHTIFLVPMMVVPAVAGYMWFMLLQGNGPINGILSILSGQNIAIPWLTNSTVAIVSVIMAEVWQWTPLMFLILVSGLVSLPEDQMRAATMLGASTWQKFRWVTLPLLKPVIIIALIIRSMEALKLFDMPYLLTGGGPAQSTETISIYLYKLAFKNFRWSYAAAGAVIVLILITILATYALRPLQQGAAQQSQEQS